MIIVVIILLDEYLLYYYYNKLNVMQLLALLGEKGVTKVLVAFAKAQINSWDQCF